MGGSLILVWSESLSGLMERNPKKCLESWADELISRASRVRNLIGEAHWLSDGHSKEAIVREYLRRHLPISLRVSRGFICSANDSTPVSPEIDVMITDSESELPWFDEGGLAIVPPTAVKGILHVKTMFGTTEIIDVFRSNAKAHESCKILPTPRSVWSGAIFFSRTQPTSDEKAAKMLLDCIQRFLKENSQPDAPNWLPELIAIVNGPVAIISSNGLANGSSSKTPTVRVFRCDKLSVAILLSHFYDSLQFRGRDLTRRGEWYALIQQSNTELILDSIIETDESHNY